MVEEKGNIEFCEADALNIPVDIWLTETQDGETDGTWTLTASNYMPRKMKVTEGAYEAVSSREELVGIIEKHILPLYETAVEKLKAMCEGKGKCLYHWDND